MAQSESRCIIGQPDFGYARCNWQVSAAAGAKARLGKDEGLVETYTV